MQGYWVILRSEMFSLFISPATYVASFYFLSLIGVGFRFFIESFSSTNWILPPLSSLVLGLIFGAPALIPFLTMRSFAEERRLGTLETLMSAPVNSWALVLGKWSASYLFFILIASGAFCFPIILSLFFPEQAKSLGFARFEHWIGGASFLFVFGASFTAIGIFASSTTKNQMVAGMLTFTLLTLYISIMAFSFGEAESLQNIDSPIQFLRACMGSLDDGLDKLQHFAVGVIDIGTILNQVIILLFFLILSTIQVERLRV